MSAPLTGAMPDDDQYHEFVPLQPPPPSRRGWWVALIGLAVFALLLGGVYVVINLADSDAPVASGPGTPVASVASVPVTPGQTAAAAVPAGPVVHYRSAAGHFAATFDHQPRTLTQTTSTAGVRATVRLAVDPLSAQGIMGVQINRTLTDAETGAFTRGILRGFQSGEINDLSPTTFRHHRAWRSTMTRSAGPDATVLVVFYPHSRVFMLLAPAGQTFTAFTKSFAVLP